MGLGIRVLRVIALYGCGSHLGHLTRNICANFRSPTLRRLHMKFELILPHQFWSNDDHRFN